MSMTRNTDHIENLEDTNPSSTLAEEEVIADDSGDMGSEIKEALSDSQIRKVRGGKVSTLSSVMLSRGSGIESYYQEFLEKANEIRDRVRHGENIDPEPILSSLHFILTNDLVEKLYQHTISAPGNADWVVYRSLDITFTALMVGAGMGYDIKMQLKLGLAAFLENVGVYRIPDNILEKGGELNRKETKILQEHPQLSYEILSEIGEAYQWLAEVALQVHERSDGSGYPHGLTRREIYELSAIIGLVGFYIDLIRDRPYRKKMIPTDAIKLIVEDTKEQFPFEIRKAFLVEITLFPVNTYVRLNNNAIGRVLASDKTRAMRPMIEILYDGKGQKVEKRKVILLSENHLLYITGCLEEEEIQRAETLKDRAGMADKGVELRTNNK